MRFMVTGTISFKAEVEMPDELLVGDPAANISRFVSTIAEPAERHDGDSHLRIENASFSNLKAFQEEVIHTPLPSSG